MDKQKILTGDQLVAKGITKTDASLPEVGMKDVIPNGSWLEQKQIQAALEARKHLVEVERIEKRGILSHAEWRDDLKLAEVTQQAGGYWQYLGYNAGKKLYLRPEEALFLMEVNCLLLKHNDLIVSLQKAYSLLLGDSIGLNQYKVYASLSRQGYKVFRHKKIQQKEKRSLSQNEEGNTSNNNSNQVNESNKEISSDIGEKEFSSEENYAIKGAEAESVDSVNLNSSENTQSTGLEDSVVSKDTIDSNTLKQTDMPEDAEISNLNHLHEASNNKSEEKYQEKSNLDIDENVTQGSDINIEITEVVSNLNSSGKSKEPVADKNTEGSNRSSKIRLLTLENRKVKPSSIESLHKAFKNVTDMFKKTTVTVNVPGEQYIPRNVFVNHTKYVLNLNMVKSKSRRRSSNERTYTTTDEVNAPHIRRLRSSSRNEIPQNDLNQNFNRSATLPRQQHFNQFRPIHFWRQGHLNNIPFNLFLQRFANNFFMPPQFNFFPNPFFVRPFHNSGLGNFGPSQSDMLPQTQNNNLNAKLRHLQSIKGLAIRLKQLAAANRLQVMHTQSLCKLIDSYNATYSCRVRLTSNFDIVEEASVVETIELDDEDEPKIKRSRLDSNNFEENLNGIKELSTKLKVIEMNYGPKPKYRRALSNVIKKFNKSYNADIYFNKEYSIVDRRHITLESSSESDCIVEETSRNVKRKKLRNPFSIGMKRVSQEISTSIGDVPETIMNNEPDPKKYKNACDIKKVFDKNWLPNEDDFGQPEVVPRYHMNLRFVDAFRDEYLYEFLKKDPHIFLNWLEAKIAFLKYLEESDKAFNVEQKLVKESNHLLNTDTRLIPLLRLEDCSDMATALERLRIFQTNKDVGEETKYKIDFDVYNRDVQNFKKSNPPKPLFRIVCIGESENFPTALDIATLNANNEDKVAIVFAVVGTGSISYLQVNCIDLPIYIPRSDLS